jgi:hypothetical protein
MGVPAYAGRLDGCGHSGFECERRRELVEWEM